MEISKEGIKKFIEEYGAKDGIKSFAELIDERVYTKVDGLKIIRKELKLPLVVAAYLSSDIDVLTESLHQSVNPVERQHIKKINRLSNLTVAKLSEKLSKLLFKEFGEHILCYGKELLLRDKEEFYNVMGKYALLDNLTSRKALLLSGFKKLDMVDDEVIFLLLSYFTKWRGEYSNYEKTQNYLESQNIAITSEKISEMKTNIGVWIRKHSKTSEIYNSKEFLNLVSYFNFLLEYEKKYYDESNVNLKVFYTILENEMKNIDESALTANQTEIESKILSEIWKEL